MHSRGSYGERVVQELVLDGPLVAAVAHRAVCGLCSFLGEAQASPSLAEADAVSHREAAHPEQADSFRSFR
jgi:hypothetical protein